MNLIWNFRENDVDDDDGGGGGGVDVSVATGCGQW